MSGVPCVEFPHSCNGRSLSGDGSHTGEVVLCWGLLKQTRHEHVSDERKNRSIIIVESISRAVTCTGELSALIRVIPSGTRLNTSRLDYQTW